MCLVTIRPKAGRQVPTETLQVFHAKLATEVKLPQALDHQPLQLPIATSLAAV